MLLGACRSDYFTVYFDETGVVKLAAVGSGGVRSGDLG